jgi:hypothetical protein
MIRDLAALQRAMAELVRTGQSASADPYVASVRASRGLRVLRECIAEGECTKAHEGISRPVFALRSPPDAAAQR